jgi:hypothetical protein
MYKFDRSVVRMPDQ